MNSKENLKKRMELIPEDAKQRIYLVQAMSLIAWNEDLTNKVKEHFAKKIELGGSHATMKFETINKKEFIDFVLEYLEKNKQELPEGGKDETPEGGKDETPEGGKDKTPEKMVKKPKNTKK